MLVDACTLSRSCTYEQFPCVFKSVCARSHPSSYAMCAMLPRKMPANRINAIVILLRLRVLNPPHAGIASCARSQVVGPSCG